MLPKLLSFPAGDQYRAGASVSVMPVCASLSQSLSSGWHTVQTYNSCVEILTSLKPHPPDMHVCDTVRQRCGDNSVSLVSILHPAPSLPADWKIHLRWTMTLHSKVTGKTWLLITAGAERCRKRKPERDACSSLMSKIRPRGRKSEERERGGVSRMWALQPGERSVEEI